ncbi:hypothetical protein NX059_006005 [Plenodomus lindquistii]|nr:hypothetical protein NX059_006005 [Plenodomus lindquistii]
MGSFLTKSARLYSPKVYTSIPNSDQHDPEKTSSSHEGQRHPPSTIVTVFSVAALILLVPVSYFLLQTSPGNHASNPTDLRIQHDNNGAFITCPDDPMSARESGCSFDLLANGWIPAPCFDAPMHHDFVDGHDYGFFLDRNGEHRVHQDTIMEGDNSRYPDGLWVTFEEHVSHCRYLVNGSVRATSRPDAAFLDVYLDRDHMMHCFGVMGEQRAPSHIETMVKAFFETRRCYIRE